MPAAEHSSYDLSVEEIEAKMAQVGFEEMRRHWADFKRSGLSLSAVDDRLVCRMRAAHMAPLFGWPVLVTLLLLGASTAIVPAWLRSLPAMDSASLPARVALGLLAVINIAFLFGYGLMLVQRYGIWPLGRAMACDLAFLLKQRSFRTWLAQTRGEHLQQKMATLGISDQWDNPGYQACYEPIADEYQRVIPLTFSERVQAILREFLGQMDPIQRKHVPGRLLRELREGKKSVTAFVARHGDHLRANAAGTLGQKDAIELVRSLLAEAISPSSPEAARITKAIQAMERGEWTPSNWIQAAIWQRDPWTDLTHQEEFYSSASLRGAKLMGRGPKGRLGTFGYLRNPSFSALDFWVGGKRRVRARIGAVVIAGPGSTTALYVDGVEGSNAIKPQIIHRALEDYAHACGFDLLAYNACVHNQIPRRCVRYLADRGLPECELSISYLDTSTREYLDAFGIPIEPFEYAYPSGAVIAHVISCREKPIADDLKRPTLLNRWVQWLRRNVIWLMLAEALLFSGILIWQSAPQVLIGLAVFVAVGMAVHFWYQFKSVRAVR